MGEETAVGEGVAEEIEMGETVVEEVETGPQGQLIPLQVR